MNLKHRVDKLEAAFAARSPARPATAFDVEKELDRWEDALDEIEGLLGGGAGLDPVVEHFNLESVNIGYAARVAGEGDAKAAQWLASIRRVPGATVALFRALPPDLRPAAASPEAINLGRRCGWSRGWIHTLAWLDSRLPPDISPAVMRSLVETLSSRYWGVTDCGVLCVSCGLRRPGEGAVEPPCPHCRSDTWVWPGRADESACRWREQARLELEPPAA